MDSFGVLAFTLAMSAFGISMLGLVYLHGRLNKLEKKLKDFDVIPKEFESTDKKFDLLNKELEKLNPSKD